MFDEMSFLFESSKQIANQFNTNKDSSRKDKGDTSQYRNTENGTQSVQDRIEYDDADGNWKFSKYTVTKSDIQNYIIPNINSAYKSSGRNPYLQLLESFNGEGENQKALKLKATDFSYLRDIGVFPINRLMILRRYPEGTVVPVDLNDLPTEPISTIVGWVKGEDDLLNFTANEVWKTQNKWLHDLIAEIILAEFGIDIKGIFPIPGWGTGFMFGLLKRMGLTDYSATDLPIGDPNLLREGVTRAHEEQGLQSTFTFNLETVYEQKYIGGIDAGVALNDLLGNALTMGTSDIRFLGKAGSQLVKDLREANNNPENPDGWKTLIIRSVKTVVDALTGTISNKLEDDSGILDQETPADDAETETEEKKTSKEKETLEGNKQKIGIVRSLISSVLASTIARYQWPIRGALNQLTGEAATPWHLTIGNPYSPLLSMNNIKVNTLDVTMGNELAYNDMSKFMTIKISLEQGRNFGKQEIESMFGVVYKREYKKVT